MDDQKMNEYLEAVNQNLKHLTLSEKEEIINEIKSHIKETQMKQGIEMDMILQQLGDPSELGKAFAGQTIANTTSFNIRSLSRTISFYGATSFGGLFLSVLAGSLYLCSFLTLLGGAVKTGGALLGFEMSFVAFIIGDWSVPDLLAFPVAIPFAVLFYYGSKKLWKVLKSYLAKASENVRAGLL